MKDPMNTIDPVRARLRATVELLERQIAALPRDTADGSKGTESPLAITCADLVAQLALGPEPAVRSCPKCGQIGMRDAKVCGHCWTKLGQLPDLDDAKAHAD